MTEFAIALDGIGVNWHVQIFAQCPKCKAGQMPIAPEGTGTSLTCRSCGHNEALKVDPNEIVAKIINRTQQMHAVNRPKPPIRAPYT